MNRHLTAEDAEDAENAKYLNGLTERIIAAAIEVHRTLGPGLLESTYEMCLCRELNIRGIPFQQQVPIPVDYQGVKLDCGYRADIIVDGEILLEIKAIDSLLPIHDAQLLTCLRLGGWKIGLLMNFNVELLKHGLRRRVLGLQEEVTL
jgi:GxxExxY protein